MIKFKANSRIGKRLLNLGRSLTAHPTQSVDTVVIEDREVVLGTTVEVVIDDIVVRGVVKWYGDAVQDRGGKRVGLSVMNQPSLVFANADDCVVVG